jgi:hypothetical protein
MADDIPFDEEPHVAMLRLGLKLVGDLPLYRKLRVRLEVALEARKAGGKVADEDALIVIVEEIRGNNPFNARGVDK